MPSTTNATPEIEIENENDYDVVVCGAGSAGSVVARRLSDDPAVRVLLLEAGGTDEVPNVMEPALWPTNLGSERDRQFQAAPDPALNGRAIPCSAGRVLGGGSSVNVMVWSRGHRADWDFFAEETGDLGWGYDAIVRGGARQSVHRSHVQPVLPRANLTVLTDALVTRVAVTGDRATGVEFTLRGEPRRVRVASEVVLCLGAIQTPKVLMQSGIGDEAELGRFGIPVVAHLPGVGRNLQDHPGFLANWQPPEPLAPVTGLGQGVAFWKTAATVDSPDVFAFALDVPFASAENAARYDLPPDAWTRFAGLLHPKSRGRVRLTGPRPDDPVHVDAAFLTHPDDLSTTLTGLQTVRDIGNSAELRPFAAREVMPAALRDEAELAGFLRDGAVTFWHQSGTARMGRDAEAVVDGELRVHGIDRLREADASILPRVPTGNTTAPSVAVGERAADLLGRR